MGLEKVLSMLKGWGGGGHKQFWGSFNVGPCLNANHTEGGAGAGQKVSTPLRGGGGGALLYLEGGGARKVLDLRFCMG